jgi:hypothetical protein
MTHILTKPMGVIVKQSDDQLPEWIKNSPGTEDDNFDIDFGSPDNPKKIKQRYISDEAVDLEGLQIYDFVQSENVIAIMDRRGGNGSRTPINQEEQEEIEQGFEEPEQKQETLSEQNKINIGEFVLMVKNKAICVGDKQCVVTKLSEMANKNEDLSEDDVIILKREPLFILF